MLHVISSLQDEGQSPLSCAAGYCHESMVALLLSNGADVNQADVHSGSSPLHQAASKGRETTVTLLLSKGARVNQTDRGGDSPLHCAAAYGNEAISALLLSKGADINQANDNGTSPLHACSNRWVAAGHDAVVALLLSNGSKINNADNYGNTPLHEAAAHGEDAVVAMLLSNGADVEKVNNKGQKPIDVAKNQKIKDMLIAHMKMKQEQPPPGLAVSTMVDESHWFQAAENGDLAVIQQGINEKIDINCRDDDGRTAVWLAAWKGHGQLVEYLITQHSDLSIANVSANDVYMSISFLTPLPPLQPILTLLPPILILYIA